MLKRRVAETYPEFEREITKSEYQRTRVMLAALLFGLLVASINGFFLDERMVAYYGGRSNYNVVLTWIVLFITYELIVLRNLGVFRRKQLYVSNTFKAVHCIIEVSMPTLLVYYFIEFRHMLTPIDSPMTLLYFLFITLSVLHLDPKICILTGAASSIQYSAVVFFGFNLAKIDPGFYPNRPENNYYLHCIVLIVTSGAAAFVSRELKRRINASFESQRAKNNIELLFGQQVSREIVTELMEERGPARKLEATVLALDIRNFSAFAEKHGPEEIMDFQNKIFSPILDIIDQHQGVVNQILGDGVMATFGTPVSNPLHADMGFLASIKIVEKVKELVRDGVIPETKIGLGVHTGEVTTGNIGNLKRKQYSISGSAVIIAFRVEQLNKELGSELLITGEVMKRIVVGKVPLTYLGLKPIKGFEYEVEIYRVDTPVASN